jgi:hypothetical protein
MDFQSLPAEDIHAGFIAAIESIPNLTVVKATTNFTGEILEILQQGGLLLVDTGVYIGDGLCAGATYLASAMINNPKISLLVVGGGNLLVSTISSYCNVEC